MSEPVYINVPVSNDGDQELAALAACIYIIERNPRSGASRELTDAEKARVVKYLADRFGGEVA